MGMFDYIRYNGKTYQTKDTPHQFMGEYEIRGDELWFNNVKYNWVENENSILGGYLETESLEWTCETHFDGTIEFGDLEEDYIALFWEGKMIRIKQKIYNDNDL